MRAAVDQEFDGVFLGGVEGWGPDEEALDFGAVGGGEPEGFHLGEVELGKEGVVEVGELGEARCAMARLQLVEFATSYLPSHG